jgi:ferrous iron transport protein B
MLSQVVYPETIEAAIAKIESLLSQDYELSLSKNYSISKRSIALLLLQKDSTFWEQVQQSEPQSREIEAAIANAQNQMKEPLSCGIAQARQQQAWNIEKNVFSEPTQEKKSFTEWLHKLTVFDSTPDNPL